MSRRWSVAAVSTTAAVGALAAAQARYTVRRRDLPFLTDFDASGLETPAPPASDIASAGFASAGGTVAPATKCSVAPATGYPAATATVRLVAMGDSTLTGPGLSDPSRIWIRQVARSIANEQRVAIDVHSVARLGARISDVLGSQVAKGLATQPDVVVVAVGTNDAVHATPLRTLERQFNRLVAQLVELVPAVVIGGVGDLGGIARVPFPLSTVARARGRQVDRIIRAATAAYGASYIDVASVDGAFRLGGRDVFGADLFHPNEAGHALWTHAAHPVVAHAVRSVLSREASSTGEISVNRVGRQ